MSKARHKTRKGLTILGIAVLAFIAVPWTLVALKFVGKDEAA